MILINKKVESKNIVGSVKIVCDTSLPQLAWLLLKLTCLDKSCCLSYNCVDTWVGNQRQSWVRKYCCLGKKYILCVQSSDMA